MSNMHMNIYSSPHNLFSVPDTHLDANRDKISGHGDIPIFLYPYHSPFDAHELIAVANALVHPQGKGIYASDESPKVMDELLKISMEGSNQNASNEEELRAKRKAWKEFACSTIPSEYVSGVIMHAETLLDFKLEPLLATRGIISGVRANRELSPIPRFENEFIVQGLDDLLIRMQVARASGARFSKWRVPVACGSKDSGYPSHLSLEIQAETLAQFAAISQQAGLVPIVEPDVEFSKDADLTRSADVHETVIGMTYERMKAHSVLLEGTLIMPSFPQPGLEHPSKESTTPEEIALATATILSRSVPPAVPGVVFSSGGLPSETATQYLEALSTLVASAPPRSPFSRFPALSFSFGRATQGDALTAWGKGDTAGAKATFEKQSKGFWHAAKGKGV